MAKTTKTAKNSNGKMASFAIKDCALVAIATGRRAQNLRELRDRLEDIHSGSIYYHFWGGMLRPQFDDPEYNNDFAAWAQHGLHDACLAERLGAIVPTEYKDLEDLRQELIEVIEERLDESEIVPWSKVDRQFHFKRSQIVVFDTHKIVQHPKEMLDVFDRLSLGSVFYHFIDARRRYPLGVDDFRAWLSGAGNKHQALIDRLAEIDPYFATLSELRFRLVRIFTDYFRRKK